MIIIVIQNHQKRNWETKLKCKLKAFWKVSSPPVFMLPVLIVIICSIFWVNNSLINEPIRNEFKCTLFLEKINSWIRAAGHVCVWMRSCWTSSWCLPALLEIWFYRLIWLLKNSNKPIWLFDWLSPSLMHLWFILIKRAAH